MVGHHAGALGMSFVPPDSFRICCAAEIFCTVPNPEVRGISPVPFLRWRPIQAASRKLAATNLALTRVYTARGTRRQRGTLEARSCGVPAEITGEVCRPGQSLCTFRKLPDTVEDRQQVDVGERELIVDKITSFRDRAVQNPDLLAQRRHDGFD